MDNIPPHTAWMTYEDYMIEKYWLDGYTHLMIEWGVFGIPEKEMEAFREAARKYREELRQQIKKTSK